MSTDSRRFVVPLILACLAGLAPMPLAAAGVAAEQVHVTRWLQLGPIAHPAALFGEGGAPQALALPVAQPLVGNRQRPAAGGRVGWFDGRTLEWKASEANRRGRLALEPEVAGRPAVVLLATYLDVARWARVKLELTGTHRRCAWLDGAVAVACGDGKDDAGTGGLEATLELTPGTHLLTVQASTEPGNDAGWTVGAILAASAEAEGEKPVLPVTLSVVPRRRLALRDILDSPSIDSMSLSPDGAEALLVYSQVRPGTHDSETWVEIRSVPDGRLLSSRRADRGVSAARWSPDGHYLSWIGNQDRDKQTSTLYLEDRQTGTTIALLDGVERLGGYLWSPTGKLLTYWTRGKTEPDKRGLKRLDGPRDRWSGFRDKHHLYLVSVPDGVTRRLTAGKLSTSARAFSPDGSRLLFTREVDAFDERPYTRTELWEVELSGFESRKLRDFAWINDVVYGPAGKRLLVTAQPSEFGDAGVDVPAGAIPNSYDTQAFIWDPETDQVQAITRDFDPTVQQVAWSRADGRIYLLAQDRDFVHLYRGHDRGGFELLPTGFESVGDFALARTLPRVLVTGSSAWSPEGLAVIDPGDAARRLAHPADHWFDGLERGRVDGWDFTTSGGKLIDGRVYLPPGFDPARKYPLIVYYYGGTSPVGRGFGGRYPKEWWAANGYVVYVLQPSGATGFGQRHSALHVNDWGKTSSEEIIQGTRKFLAAHDFVDPRRVGCIGASYGGFMTMLLSTRTDVFAAAVAHAGISSIASYWGEGNWGYLYSSVATADSFPWNRRDIYVGQSPLFRADEARVPILLTHGRADTNVPVGESDQFFVALKLLGKTVEYVQVEGEDHWILTHEKRLAWSETILAWFERWLKDQPGWWDATFPE